MSVDELDNYIVRGAKINLPSIFQLLQKIPVRTSNLQDVLLVLQTMRQGLLDRQLFRGFSGPSRAISGCIALSAAAIMASPIFPATNRAHLLGWGVVLLLATFINGFALFYWFLNDERVGRDVRRLKPVLDTIPPLLVGAGLSVVFVLRLDPQPLFGIWMCMFGLSNLASRNALPSMIGLPGIFYIVAGFICLSMPGMRFTNPWPMGIVFFAGEMISGTILYVDRRRCQVLDRMMRETEA